MREVSVRVQVSTARQLACGLPGNRCGASHHVTPMRGAGRKVGCRVCPRHAEAAERVAGPAGGAPGAGGKPCAIAASFMLWQRRQPPRRLLRVQWKSPNRLPRVLICSTCPQPANAGHGAHADAGRGQHGPRHRLPGPHRPGGAPPAGAADRGEAYWPCFHCGGRQRAACSMWGALPGLAPLPSRIPSRQPAALSPGPSAEHG